MASNRIGRINEEIQRELSSLIRTLKDPRVQSGMVTITHVDTTSDLRYSPELQFIADDSIEYGAHILELLRDPRVVKPANPENETLKTEDEQE